jgi:hypothetical protein
MCSSCLTVPGSAGRSSRRGQRSTGEANVALGAPVASSCLRECAHVSTACAQIRVCLERLLEGCARISIDIPMLPEPDAGDTSVLRQMPPQGAKRGVLTGVLPPRPRTQSSDPDSPPRLPTQGTSWSSMRVPRRFVQSLIGRNRPSAHQSP